MMNWKLPNPFLNEKGEIADLSAWDLQRAYLRDILADDFYGRSPEAPGNVTAEKKAEKTLWDGKGLFEVYELRFGPESSLLMTTAMIRPSEGKALPIVLMGGYVDEEIAKMAVLQGFCIATPLVDELAPDSPDYRKGTLYRAYPENSFKVIRMWGWLLSRVIDWLETADFAEPEKYTVVGHSRYGKAALSCAVFDERVKVTAAGGSGCGGMGSLRVCGSRFGEGTGKAETLGSMLKDNFPHWYVDSLQEFGADAPSEHFRENELRFDANFIGSVIAPRPLLVLEGLDDAWANPYGTLASWSAAAEVYHYLSADENCAIHFREGGHALNISDWRVILDFCSVKLKGEERTPGWRIRQYGDPLIARDWNSPGPEEEMPENASFASPEMLKRILERFNQKWAFSEFGLETGMDRYIRGLLEKAGKEESNE
ncbi:MAG: hypothetical protein IKR59_03295 [Lachnospiraceae bacterium]|nr:hypothetical protein [Lachnospiraceae bacterium]